MWVILDSYPATNPVANFINSAFKIYLRYIFHYQIYLSLSSLYHGSSHHLVNLNCNNVLTVFLLTFVVCLQVDLQIEWCLKISELIYFSITLLKKSSGIGSCFWNLTGSDPVSLQLLSLINCALAMRLPWYSSNWNLLHPNCCTSSYRESHGLFL